MSVASIPSPADGTINIGPVELTAYGLAIALGVIVAAWLAGRRFEEKGIGTRDDLNAMAVGGVIAGVVGARLYHVATDWEKFENNLGDIPKIWEGGLGIPGGLLLGTVVAAGFLHRRGIPAGIAANCAAPAIALAQSIGRWGNYFNQELYGNATDLPWALEIDPENLPQGVAPGTTFHPTFLYESIWNLALCGVLLLIDRRFRMRPWQLFAVYLAGYGVGRFWIEGLRIDEAKEFGGLRLNQWMSLVLVIGGLGYLLWTSRRPAPALAPAGGVTGEETDNDIDPEVGDDDETPPGGLGLETSDSVLPNQPDRADSKGQAVDD